MDLTTIFMDSSSIMNETASIDFATEQRYLSILSHKKAMLFLPVTIFISIIMVTGIFGNMLVIYIYSFRYKKTVSNYFIVTMAVLDSIACFVVIPIDIFDNVHNDEFYSSFGCKVFRYLESTVTMGSSYILIVIAVDRYLKICRPLKMVTEKMVKVTCTLTVIVALLCAIPSLILFGIKRSRTAIPGVRGYDCSIEEQYKRSMLRTIYYSLLMIILFLTLIVLAGLYIRIWVQIKRRMGSIVGDDISQASGSTNNTAEQKRKSFLRMRSISEDSSSVSFNKKSFARSVSQNSTGSRLASISEAISRAKPSKTTKIFMLVTFAFVLSFCPTIVIQVLFLTNKSLAKSSSIALLVTLKALSRSHYINNAVNPIIYCFLNVNFRKHCRNLLKDIRSFSFRRMKRQTSKRGSFRPVKVSGSDTVHRSLQKSGSVKSSPGSPTKELEMDQIIAPAQAYSTTA